MVIKDFSINCDGIKKIILPVILFFLMFQSIFQTWIPGLRYYDEGIAILMATYGLIVLGKKGTKDRLVILMALCVLLFVTAGTVSSLLLNWQSKQVAAGGLFLSIKWWLLFFGIYSWTKYHEQKRILLLLYISGSLLLMIVWQGLSVVYALGKYSFFAWWVCANAVCVMGLLFVEWEGSRCEYFILFLTMVLAVSTTRTKGYCAVSLAALLIFYVLIKKRKITKKELVIIGIVLVVVAGRKIFYYYYLGLKHDYSRPYMLKKAVEIANDHFPIGTGWSTYGSYLSVENYSPAYWFYDMGYHAEVGFTHRKYMNDNYLASVIGETGWLGFAALLMFCIVLFMAIQRLYVINSNLYASGLMVFFYLMITFVEESGLQQPALMSLAVNLGFVLGDGYRQKEMMRNDSC